MKNLALAVDGDYIAYRVAAACEEEDAQECCTAIDNMLYDARINTNINRMRVYLGGKDNFRIKAATTKPYKGNRKDTPKPRHLAHCRRYLITDYKAIVVNGYEADDAIATDMVVNGAWHCGVDKDLHQVAGTHYNVVTKATTVISEEEAILTYYRQLLTGDSTDNIGGLPQIGAVKASNAITDATTARRDTIEMYKQVCADKLPDVVVRDYFNEQEAFVKMVTTLNLWDLITHEVKQTGLNI